MQLDFNVAIDSVEALIVTAIRGGGLVQSMDLMVAGALASGKLQAVLPDWSAPGAPLSIVCRRGARDVPKVRVFADFAAELLREHRQRVDALLEQP
jgi:LysR family transcriptional regulator, regulator for bpeEF and oprC